jgi:hypothetical protein
MRCDMNVFEERIEKAIEVAERYGGIDGGHHKQWVIDQMIRALKAHKYEEWVEGWEGDEDEWDVGIAP